MEHKYYKYNWQVYTAKERYDALEQIKLIAAEQQAWLIDFKMYSDLAAYLRFEIEAQYLAAFYDHLNAFSPIEGDKPNTTDQEPECEIQVLLNISFSRGQGKRLDEIPKVPG
jgi:hypothetical protein